MPVDSSTQCLGCGYALRTLAADGQCPECGQAVAESLAAFASHRPRELVIVGGWFMLAGVTGTAWLIFDAIYFGRPALPVTLVQIPLGIGLWRGVPSARIWAMLIIGLHLLSTPLAVAIQGWQWASGQMTVDAQSVEQMVYMAYLVAWLPVSWWQWRTLRRPHVRRVFDVPYHLAR
ncbi:MAG: hypothetical protein WDZ31_10515 [Phycisphaeraceae bacterium]